MPKLPKSRVAIAAEQNNLQSGFTRTVLWKENTLISKKVWCHGQADIWLKNNTYFRFRTVFRVKPFAQFLPQLLEADADLSDPKIRPWMQQRKISLEVLWEVLWFYAFTYNLLPLNVKVREQITRDLWRRSVWPLWFCFLFLASWLKSATKFLFATNFTVCDSTLLTYRLEKEMHLII